MVVGHPHRHHLYHTALAYRQTDRLVAFVTERYVHRPARLKPLQRLPVPRLSRWARKLARYNDPDLSAFVRLRPARGRESLMWRMLGAPALLLLDPPPQPGEEPGARDDQDDDEDDGDGYPYLL